MSYLTLQNDRKRRRRAKLVTFLIATAVLGGAAYGMGALEGVSDLLHHLLGTAPAGEAVAAVI